jgi:hypothetical protein
MKRAIAALASSCAITGTWAASTDYVHTPTVDHGEREIDIKFGSAERDDGRDRAASIGFGWTPVARWLTEPNAHWQEEPGGGMHLRAFEWENKFQLTDLQKTALEVGLLVELEYPHESADPRELILGALLQRKFGRTQLNANVLLEREFGGDEAEGNEAGGDRAFELGYQWQLRYAWRPAFHLGVQGFGGVGAWDDWAGSDEQEHSAGPALFGELPFGDDEEIEFNTALLFATGGAAPHHTFRLQIELEF